MCGEGVGRGGGEGLVLCSPYVPWRYPNNPGLNKASSLSRRIILKIYNQFVC